MSLDTVNRCPHFGYGHSHSSSVLYGSAVTFPHAGQYQNGAERVGITPFSAFRSATGMGCGGALFRGPCRVHARDVAGARPPGAHAHLVPAAWAEGAPPGLARPGGADVHAARRAVPVTVAEAGDRRLARPKAGAVAPRLCGPQGHASGLPGAGSVFRKRLSSSSAVAAHMIGSPKISRSKLANCGNVGSKRCALAP